MASCKKCRLQYAGSAPSDFRIRFCNHKSAMLTNKTTCEVAVHLNKMPHTLNDFSFQCINQVQAPNNSEEIDRLLITKEAYWSAQLFSLAPHGLNKRKEFHSKTEFVIISFHFLSLCSFITNCSKALFLDFVSPLRVRSTQRPCPWITHWALALVKGIREPHEVKKKSFDLGGNRTHDLRIRFTVPLPTELRGRTEKVRDDLGGESRRRESMGTYECCAA